MKKLFVLTLAFCLFFGIGNIFAGESNHAISGGFLDIDAKAKSGASSWDYSHAPRNTGLAIGGGLAGGKTKASAIGMIFNGTIEADVSVTGGGITGTTAFESHDFHGNYKEVRVGSMTENWASTHGKIKVKAEVASGVGMGFIGGGFKGKAGQISGNASYLVSGPALDSNGFTGGIAAQGSAGYINGHAWAGVMGYASADRYYGGEPGDRGYYIKVNGENTGEIHYFSNGHPENESEWEFLGKYKDLKAGAGAGAGIDMYGWSYTESFRSIDKFEGGKTESMGTFVGAGTEVDSYGYDYDWDRGRCGFSDSGANVNGGWVAAGGVATFTKQGNEYGTAKAGAVGVYFGAGNLGSNFNGSAVGYSTTSVTTLNGYNGSINSATSGMKVTAAASGRTSQQID